MFKKLATFAVLAATVAVLTLAPAQAQDARDTDLRVFLAERASGDITDIFTVEPQPGPLQEQMVQNVLPLLPSFGEATVERLSSNAPYQTVRQLAALTFETEAGERFVLQQKQLNLIAAFWNLDSGIE